MAGKTIQMVTDDNETIEFQVVEQTMIGNINYLLVTESDEDEAEAYIMKEIGADTEDAFYEFVEDETELEAIMKVFAEILEDIELEYE